MSSIAFAPQHSHGKLDLQASAAKLCQLPGFDVQAAVDKQVASGAPPLREYCFVTWPPCM